MQFLARETPDRTDNNPMSSRTPTGIWPKRIFLAHGPGDAGKTLLAWAEKREDDSITARTYSSQIYDLATELGAQVEVLVDNPNGKRFSTDNISVEPFPMRSANYKGARFWIEVERHAAQMADRAARFGADLAIVHNHYSLIAL